MEDKEISLRQLLLAREERAKKQTALLSWYGMPIISFMVNTPGTQKNTPLSRSIFNEGYKVLIKELNKAGCSVAYNEKLDLVTGMEGYIVADVDEIILKKLAISIETEHPLGRLFDIDVIGRSGRHLTRVELGFKRRKCLLCDNEAHVCSRSRAHSTKALLDKIREMEKCFRRSL